MRLLYLNPNSSRHMTDSIVEAARRARPDVEIVGWTNEGAPPAIQGPDDGAAAIPGLVAALPRARIEGFDAIVIACFDDTGLEQLRKNAHCPVLGIGQSACATATLLGLPYSVVTTLSVSVPVIAENIRRGGYAALCTSVRASEMSVLTVEAGGDEVCQRLAAVIGEAAQAEGARAAVLGCAGMAGLKQQLSTMTAQRLIDGVEASVHLAAAMAAMR
ncbi:aspartate/glutamate racemase family protein [Paracoccus sp. MBLB3053]|uniref:Aspartate/glutamate racemase family protein n=1 Tax=Paracoccus aurantius TaxID=3073814 RepID=A0ABU2HXJ0_9RHOB|nr:aspartate/glutamate racemase family protein [Paracoccus sp. MBLB3053]MDS9469442.1 aspartate/glutamate racemase family protein [Paracoccus sp. MBLB3053]